MAIQKHYTILCIDDDRDDLELLEIAFKSAGTNMEIVKAYDGREGLDTLKKLKQDGELPHLIVLDLNMPGLNGKETFLEIKKDPFLHKIPVIVLSTSIVLKDKTFFDVDHVECLTKPIEYEKYYEVAKKMLEKVLI